MSVEIAPKFWGDEEALAKALSRVQKDLGPLTVRHNPETGAMIICGTGEIHLAIALDRLRRAAELVVGRPRVLYRETIRSEILEEAIFIRETGGRRQFAGCKLRLEPQSPGTGLEFVNLANASVPLEYVPSVEKGIREAAESGPLAGFPVTDIKVSLVSGMTEPESSEMAFKIAGGMAFRAGCKKANPTLLEPVMKVEVIVPDRWLEPVVSDLEVRRATILRTEDRDAKNLVVSTVPLNELFGYTTALRGLSSGRASVTIEFSHYDKLPWNIFRARVDPPGDDEPPTASAGRPVLPIRPKPGISGADQKPFPRE